MRLILILAGCLTFIVNAPALAASYVDTSGFLHDPIQHIWLGDLAYSGNNLEPNANLTSATLDSADLRFADLYNANLSHADMRGAYLVHSDLRYANLSSGRMRDANLLYADLSYANLSDTYLYDANLFSADLSNANLSSSDLRSTHMRYVDLHYADLSGADLSSADLRGADLSGANLSNVDFDKASIHSVDFTDSILFSADLSGAYHMTLATSWAGAKYSLNAKDNNGNPIPDTIFNPAVNPVALGMIAIPEPTTALLLGLGLAGLSMRRRSAI